MNDSVRRVRAAALFVAVAFSFAACSSTPLPQDPPALSDMEQPLDLSREPEDEAARQALPMGAFSGLVVEDSRDTLDAKLEDEGQVRIAQVIENSPAMAAGLLPDDLLIEARVDGGAPIAIARTSDWRNVELQHAAGTRIDVLVDRAGRECRASLTLAVRVRPAPRTATETFSEQDRVGVVVRTATEVEARAAGLAPGAGAVLVGLSRRSPWRQAGLRFLDMVVEADGRAIAHPQDLLQALRNKDRDAIKLVYVRDGARNEVEAPLSQRESETQSVLVPLLYRYEHRRGVTEWACLLGLFSGRSTKAAWDMRVFWLISFGGGDSDRLVEGGS
jgi:C-terminal processing protease CtpA/Prc